MFLMQHDLTVWSMPLDETSTRWNKVGGDLGFPGSFFTHDIPQKRLVLQSDMIVRKWHWNVEFLIVIGRVL